MSAANEALVRRLFDEAWNGGRLESVDELVAADAVPAHVDGSPGPQTWKEAVAFYRSSFSDLSYVIDDMFSSGDRVAVRWRATGRDSVGFLGRTPTHITATVTGITIYRLADGKFVEHWDEFDMAGLMKQLEEASVPAPS